MTSGGVGIIVLAAGGSTRMGRPKQLLKYNGKTLLGLAIEAALGSVCRPVIVVIGANAQAMQAVIGETGARAICNPGWEEGMASSIRLGLAEMQRETAGEATAVVFTLCDQPFVTSATINRLVDCNIARAPLLAACEFDSDGEITRGVPALFSRALFGELLEVTGAEGAKVVINRHAAEAEFIHAPEAVFDVDTPDDYLSLGRDRTFL